MPNLTASADRAIAKAEQIAVEVKMDYVSSFTLFIALVDSPEIRAMFLKRFRSLTREKLIRVFLREIDRLP